MCFTGKQICRREKLLFCTGDYNMENGSKFYMVKKKALPEILLKVAEANVLLNRGKAKTIKEAIDAVGISRLNEEVYVDFKNWDESMQVDRENELKKIRQKMRMVGAKRVYIINIVVEDGTKYEIKESTDGIIEIPGLITKNGDIITKPIEKLAKEVK